MSQCTCTVQLMIIICGHVLVKLPSEIQLFLFLQNVVLNSSKPLLT